MKDAVVDPGGDLDRILAAVAGYVVFYSPTAELARRRRRAV
jgi:hypothetical protein